MSVHVGIAFDSHRFAEGRKLILGGEEIEHDVGLAGHSDADVLTHAVIDALLGAAGQGDIGERFPDDEEEWEGADSMRLLRLVIAELDGTPVNVDATVICERPKLGSRKAAIAAALTDAVGAPVSVKATTNEGMGAIGRGEGIAAIAVAAVERD